MRKGPGPIILLILNNFSIISCNFHNQSGTIEWNGELSETFLIPKGIDYHRCILFPRMFTLYTKQVLNRNSNFSDTSVNVESLKASFRYEDDTALLENSTNRVCEEK